MTNQTLKLEDFGAQKLSKNQQKTVRGGDTPTCPPTTVAAQEGDPGKGTTSSTP